MGYKLSNKIKIHPIDTPCRKKMYNSPEEAQAMINYIKENRITKKIHPYKCSICGFWHLTSKSR